MFRSASFQLTLRRLEPLLFLGAVLYLASEIFSCAWVTTEDGPAHIYNSVMLGEALSGNEFVLSHFGINLLVPNLLGHAILLLASLVFPIDVADKLIHLIIIAGLCYGFRFLAGAMQKEKRAGAWLILPLVYSTVYYYGF
jgi:hypothetical protein